MINLSQKNVVNMAKETNFIKDNVEMYQYVVDENFPKVIEQSFVDGVLPKGIIDISYTVDLNGLEAVNLME